MRIIPQRATAFLTISFFDSAGVPMPPENAVYRIDDLDSGASIKANTNFIVPPSGIFVLRLSPDDNDLVNSNNKTENHRVSVTGLYNSTSDEVPGAYDLKIRRVFL